MAVKRKYTILGILLASSGVFPPCEFLSIHPSVRLPVCFSIRSSLVLRFKPWVLCLIITLLRLENNWRIRSREQETERLATVHVVLLLLEAGLFLKWTSERDGETASSLRNDSQPPETNCLRGVGSFIWHCCPFSGGNAWERLSRSLKNCFNYYVSFSSFVYMTDCVCKLKGRGAFRRAEWAETEVVARSECSRAYRLYFSTFRYRFCGFGIVSLITAMWQGIQQASDLGRLEGACSTYTYMYVYKCTFVLSLN